MSLLPKPKPKWSWQAKPCHRFAAKAWTLKPLLPTLQYKHKPRRQRFAAKVLAQHMSAEMQKLIPVATDPESQDRIRDLEQQLGDLRQQLQNERSSQQQGSLPAGVPPGSSPSTPCPAPGAVTAPAPQQLLTKHTVSQASYFTGCHKARNCFSA